MSRIRPILIALLLVGLVALPIVVESDSIVNLALLVLLYINLASSWNILGGYAGQTNLGHAAFFGTGALVTRTLWLSGFNLFLSLAAGGVAAVAFALLIGIPAFRLRGVYFAIGTLALAQIMYITVGNTLPEISSLSAATLESYQLRPRYYLFLALTVAITAGAYWLVNSRTGLGMMAVREQEDAAEATGVNALKHKLLALTVSALCAGLTGGAFAYYHVGFYPQMPFGPEWTFDSMMMAYIGGAGTIVGPIIGAVFFVVVRELLALKLPELHLIVFGVLFIVVVLFFPGGLVGGWTKLKKVWANRTKARQGPQGRAITGQP